MINSPKLTLLITYLKDVKEKKKILTPSPHGTEDFYFYLRKLELHYCKKSAKNLCKAGQTLKSPI